MKAKLQRVESEWICGTVSMPGYVTGESEPYRPEVLVWLDDVGTVVGGTVVAPAESAQRIADSFAEALTRPEAAGRRPTRIRVAEPDLAAKLRAAYPEIDVVCAPTPELATVAESMREYLAAAGEREKSYLSEEIDAARVASFFRAAAGLFRAAPWQVVPDDEALISITIEQLGVRDVVMTTIGHLGESLGFMLFSSLGDFDDYLDAAEFDGSGEPPPLPQTYSLNFEHEEDLAPTLLEEISRHGWEVAAVDAFPWVIVADGELVSRPPSAKELTIVEAIALAVPQFLQDREKVVASFEGGEALVRTISVTTGAGPVDVALRAPYPGTERLPPMSGTELLTRLRALADAGEAGDEAELVELDAELMRRFDRTPHGANLPHLHHCALLFDIARRGFGASIVALQVDELRKLLFEILPRVVALTPELADEVVAQGHAFFSFMETLEETPEASMRRAVFGNDAARMMLSAAARPRTVSKQSSAAERAKKQKKRKDAKNARRKNR